MSLIKSFILFCAAALASLPVTACAQDNLGFDAYLELVAAKARGEGVSESAIRQVLDGLTENPRVVALDRGQPGSTAQRDPNYFPPFQPYFRRTVDAARIAGGRRTLRNLGPLADRVEREYGVPAEILVAIWGKESAYGAVKGDFDLARALATLAYEGRRRDLFEPELIDLMKMVDRGVPRARLVGSWAGAFGNPQFLPSVYLRIAKDGDGDGDADIWNSPADTLASIASYFVDAGWQPGLPWGVPTVVPSGFDRTLLENPMQAPYCPRVHVRHAPWKTVREWRALGIVPAAPISDDTLVSLIEPDGPGNTAYLLTSNYRTILEYNCSNFYALGVGLLANEIAR
ncbi:lytic murein transglycosylase [Pseudoblastomonas halimionae]|uniref:Lytic murein transglycosylase n=1 Tax=Alteriqipengyuania halimionae TaxID=1926630 RepID=A0A6I4U2H0_9SPHN|nr:lytic murein transglycosylase [Alteriqipengyuania halimionae]MXP09484.1 lytic murein transglycosylase [Alteriqipengyuania halimionae]